MKIQRKISLFSILGISALSLIIIVSGTLIINGILLELNTRVLRLELGQVMEKLDMSYRMMKLASESDSNITINRSTIISEIEETARISAFSGQVFILDSQGKPLSSKTLISNNGLAAAFSDKLSTSITGLQRFSFGMNYYIALARDFMPFGWTVGTFVTAADLYAERNRFILMVAVIVALFSLILIILLRFLVRRAITGPLNDVLLRLHDIAQGKGDLTRKITIKAGGELGQLADSFNRFIDEINNDIVQVKNVSLKINALSDNSITTVEGNVKPNIQTIEQNIQKIDHHTTNSSSGVEQLSSTLEEIVRNIDSITRNTEKQASSVEESASSIEEMVRNIENTAAMTSKTKDISKNLSSVANEGGESVKTAVTSIREVADYSQQILKMLQLITNIAKQTNLLAMNAAIEAAHAGEAGKGFAIVADEIRRLSEDTNKNAKEIGEVVGSIVSRISESVSLAEKAGLGLDMIVTYSNQNAQIVEQLNVTMEEQSHGAKEILRATQELVQITEEVKMSMNEQKSASNEFTLALKDIREVTGQNQSVIKEHFTTLKTLIGSIEQIETAVTQNRELASKLGKLVNQFILDEKPRESEKTELKLVE